MRLDETEIENAGIAFPPHDLRYAYGREWMTVVEPLLRGARVQHEGEHFHVRDYMLRPAGTYRTRLLQFQPFAAEMRRFAQHVFPRVR